MPVFALCQFKYRVQFLTDFFYDSVAIPVPPTLIGIYITKFNNQTTL